MRKNEQYDVIEDGPSSTLLEYMSQYNFNAPENWPGYRELSEK